MVEQEYVDIQNHIVFNGKKIVFETCKVVAKASSISKEFKKILQDDYAVNVEEHTSDTGRNLPALAVERFNVVGSCAC
ncbi:MAG: hypothetical protein Q8O17_04445 [Candidatus Methanoperedens sp.]|nr:hypothetical protein [Candidatus Methanoperedens sp.]